MEEDHLDEYLINKVREEGVLHIAEYYDPSPIINKLKIKVSTLTTALKKSRKQNSDLIWEINKQRREIMDYERNIIRMKSLNNENDLHRIKIFYENKIVSYIQELTRLHCIIDDLKWPDKQ